ncbi:MAG: hypothetical protein A3H06_00170 [Candidatus Colwellbacteria bacterium RIFCSPLOWO2_12_FULL_44_13]|uniref:Large ribosomal subunit protein uL15 n=2 Tax=Candidatus Colwelliibacteriota TaxID=1817904 RepID=A0A1G1Z714_9BACT|nr:MAG: hypothetical protein A3I31_00475 [Candidatus Colwellbacteria bacterium RIFCSPLOWO2_02_FULL_44_20b]OGY61511.1 MAG: hypothetical protein A3H06_00170 [Candidatus Colwellbacteria bacterium RIFCSPLOWO2_12_FULL_44_13]
MQLHELKSNNPKRSKKRIARGGKRGTRSGRGQKGQKSRAGHKIRPASRDLLIRIPKLRGFANKTKSEKRPVINLTDLEKMKTTEITKETVGNVKILGKGELKKAVKVIGVKVSKQAAEKIKAAGGSVA